MLRGHRRAHLWIWLALAPVLMALVIAGLLNRPRPVAPHEPAPAATTGDRR